jgi:hypothetical protein
MIVRRNFQPNIYDQIESINLKGNYYGLLISLSQYDFTFLLEVLQSFGQKSEFTDPDLKNVEQQQSLTRPTEKSSEPSKIDLKQITNIKNRDQEISTKKTPKIFIKFDVKSIKMYLHDRDTKILVILILLIFILIFFHDTYFIKIQFKSLIKKIKESGKNERSTVDAFSKFELSELKFELNLFNDTNDVKDSMLVIFFLDNIILDDTRLINKKPIR